MKTTFVKVMVALQALAALALIGAVKIFAPVCSKMLTLESGKEVHMKCFYTGQTALVLAVLLLAVAVLTWLARQDLRRFALLSIGIGVAIFLVFTGVIGVCANPDMACNTTAVWAKISAAVAIAASLGIIFSGKEGQLPS